MYSCHTRRCRARSRTRVGFNQNSCSSPVIHPSPRPNDSDPLKLDSGRAWQRTTPHDSEIATEVQSLSGYLGVGPARHPTRNDLAATRLGPHTIARCTFRTPRRPPHDSDTSHASPDSDVMRGHHTTLPHDSGRAVRRTTRTPP